MLRCYGTCIGKSELGCEAPGTPKNAAEAQPGEAAEAFQSCKLSDSVNQVFLFDWTSEKWPSEYGGVGSVCAGLGLP